MPASIASIAALLLSVALLLMGNGLQSTLLPVRANIEAYASLEIGLLGSAYFIGFAAGCFWGPRAVRRAGHVRAFLGMVSVASTVALIHLLILAPTVWWILRGVTGFCFAVLYIVIESWLNERATNETRGTIFSIYVIINLTVITIGQLMIMLADPADFPLFCLASILVSLAAIPIAFSVSPAPTPLTVVRVRPRHLFNVSPVGFMGCLAVGAANGSFWALGPVFAQERLVDTMGIALFMSIAVISGALGQWPLGRLSDRIDRRHVLGISCAGAALAGIGLALIPDDMFLTTLALGALFGAFAFPVYSLTVAHANDFAVEGEYVETASGLLLVYGVGASLGPFIASSVMTFLGVGGLFAITAAVHVATVGYILHRLRQRDRAPDAERVTFSQAVTAANTVSPLDGDAPQSGETDRES